MWGSRLIACVVVVTSCGLYGCSNKAPEIPYEQIDVPGPTRVTLSGRNAFDGYVSLAKDAARLDAIVRDTNNKGEVRRDAKAKIDTLLPQLAQVTNRRCQFIFEPTPPFGVRRNHIGWNALGEALVERVEDAVDESDWDSAVHWTVVATTFGFDLCGGSLRDSSLGFGVVNSVRKKIVSHLGELSGVQLNALSDGLAEALSRMPDGELTLEHEGYEMLLAMKTLQDAHKEGTLGEFADSFSGRSKRTVLSLEELDDAERSEFFRALVAERKSVLDQLVEQVNSAGAHRERINYSDESSSVKLMTAHFFSSGDPWLAQRDRTVARSRLFALSAAIKAYDARNGSVPRTLSEISKKLNVDPFTNDSFGYMSLGRGFKIYSYGSDGMDDRGDSNNDRLSPDLLLEDALL